MTQLPIISLDDVAALPEDRGTFLRRTFSIALAYALSGALALSLRVPLGDAAAVWPPAGIALAALLLYGNRYAFAIALGNFALIATNTFDSTTTGTLTTGLALSAVTATGAALQALVGATLVAATVRRKLPLSDSSDIARFLLLAGPLACTINASISVASLVYASQMPSSAWTYNWWTWWIGDTIGVVIFAPIVLMWFGPARIWQPRRLGATLALSATLLVCVAMFFSAIRYQWLEMRQGLDNYAQVAASLLSHRLDGQREAVSALRGLFEDSESVSDAEFTRHANERLDRHQELLSIGWVPRIAGNDRERFEREISDALGAPTQISDVTMGLEPLRTTVVRAAERAEYYPIRYRVRRDPAVMRVGMDLGAYPTLLPTLKMAMESGAVVVSPPFRTSISNLSPREVAMITPVYDRTLPMRSNAEQRHAHFLGFVVVGADLSRLAAIATARQPEEQLLSLTVLDSEEPDAAALRARAESTLPATSLRRSLDMVAAAPLTVGNREWLLMVTPQPEYFSATNRWIGWWALAGGMVASMLVCMSTLLMTGRNEAVQALVRERTDALDRLNESLAGEIAERKRAQATLLDLNQGLEQRVIERTADLQRQTQELLVAKEERSELLQRLTMAMHSAGISMWEWDLKTDDSRIMEGSAFTERLGGRTTYKGSEYPRLVCHPDDQATWSQVFTAGISQPPGQDLFSHRYRAIYPDGSLHWIQFHCRVIRNSVGKAKRLLGVDWDITAEVLAQQEIEKHTQLLEQRVTERTAQLARSNSKLANEILDHQRAEVELRDATLQLQETMQAKDIFLANISHELRTPLTSILGYAGTLLMGLSGDMSPLQKRHMENIKRSGEHLLSLISDLLDLSKAEAGKTDIACEPLSCADVVAEVKGTLQPLADNKDLAFDVEPIDPALAVHADRRSLQQILLNLASNAIKFTDQGRVVISVARVQCGTEPRIAIAIRDSGIGISSTDQAHLFQAFSRVFRESAKRREGTGLGLHLSRKLAQMMDGNITVQSEPGKGSTFTLELRAA